MVWRTFKLAFCASALAVPLWALADEAPAPPPPPLAVKAQVGYVSSHGNTDAQTANAKLEVTLNSPDWKHDLQLAGLYGKSSDIVSAEMFDAQWQSSYNITNRFYAFGALHYDDDKFSGFQYQETLAAGGGYSVVKLKDATLDLQVGVGYRRLRPEEIDKDAAGEVISRTPLEAESGAVATATINGMYAFNSSTKLTEVVASGVRIGQYAAAERSGSAGGHVQDAVHRHRLRGQAQQQSAGAAGEDRFAHHLQPDVRVSTVGALSGCA